MADLYESSSCSKVGGLEERNEKEWERARRHRRKGENIQSWVSSARSGEKAIKTPPCSIGRSLGHVGGEGGLL